MDTTITTKKTLKGLPDDTGARQPGTKEEVDRAEAMRVYREKAKADSRRVLKQYREQIDPRPPRPSESEMMNDNLVG